MKCLIQIRGDRIVRQIPLKKTRYTLGRGPENDIVFDTPKVSRLHAILVEEGDTFCIVDQDSANHVFVNGEQVKRKRLPSEDKINLSRETTLLYLSESDADEKVTRVLNHLWEAIGKKGFLRLKEVTNRIISLDSLDHILDIILEEVVKLVGAERGFIALTDEKGEIQTDTGVSHAIPLNKDSVRRSVFSHSIVRRAIQSRENIFILNTEDSQEGLSNSVLDLDLRSIMCAPLLFGDKPVGVLYVDSGYQLPDFSEMDHFFFTILADHAAIAIENAKLYSQAQMSVQQLGKEVQESEERYRQLVELSPEAIAVHSEGKIVFVNAAVLELLGAEKPQQILGKPVMEMVHPDYREIVRERIHQQMKKDGRVPLLEEKFLRLDGSSVDVEVAAASLIYQGKPAVLVIARDITERKRAEIARKQTLAELERHSGHLAALHETALDIAARREMIDLLEAVVSRAANLLGVTGGGVYIVDPDNETLTLAALYGPGKEFLGAQLRKGEDMAGKVLESGQPLIVEDYEQWAGRSKVHPTMQWGSVVKVPLLLAGQVIGVLGCHTGSGSPRAFDQDDVRLLEDLAQQAAIAIENAQLFAKAQHHAEELEERVRERTAELRRIVNTMAGREVRMADLKGVIRQLRAQLEKAGLTPVAEDPLLAGITD